MSDRTVHAVTHKGLEIVRYDRGGKWYLEWPPAASVVPRRQISVEMAASTAVEHGAKIHFDLPGGGSFDAKVRRLRAFERDVAGSG